ncbi:MAG: hypothetical protein ACLS9R_05345 [Anaerobutyricum hallii]|uniref:hypothetical protein n=1 Tax=Anaerobutyricum hallii TaxID=39488 RepID=UPI0039932F16
MNDKYNPIDITWEDFETYLPDYQFDEKQIQFFKDTLEMILHNRNTSKVTCFGTRCGIGKSTMIHTLMHCCIGDCRYEARHEPQGLVVVTDSIKRLEELSDSDRDTVAAEKFWGEWFTEFGYDNHYRDFKNNVIVLKSGEPFKEQLIKQHYRPIVLLSTQRYFMLEKNTREQLFSFTYKGKSLKRDIVIFDECPQFSEIVTINSLNLSKIESALYEGLSNEVKDKSFVIKEYKAFKDRLLDQMDEKENLTKNSNVIIYWKDERYSSITPNDDLFFKVIHDNLEALLKEYNSFLKDILCLKKIAQEGAIFECIKKKSGEKYKRSFKLLIDNREYFYLGQDKKFFIFDATADIDPRYDLDYIEIIKGEKYNKPLNMLITNVKMSTSRNVLCKNNKRANATVNAIIDYLKDKKKNGFGNKEILVVVYSSLIKKFQKDFDNIGYFGNLKGFNDFNKLCRMAHIGMNRFPNLIYFFIYCGCHMEVYRKLSQMSEKESMEFFDKLIKNHNEEYDKIITDVMMRSMLADFEQNIFRLAIRNYSNTKPVHIWTFYNTDNDVYKLLSTMIEKRYSPYDVKFEYEDAPDKLKIEMVKNRKPPKGKRMTNAQKILEWCDNQQSGKEFKLSELLHDVNLSNDTFKKTKKNNQIIKSLFDNMKTDKKGYYKIN